ncbi:coactosin family protein [Nocardia sp. CC227C]|uniref:coactosin family protein n=1 Tax=Nocardia sp. CC227C TaxID=3044562 RepID=UPI00278BB12C|nr:coactosin family protein [Nocardia sp. CC227C]
MSLKVDNEAELREARNSLFSENGTTSGWLLLNYVGASTVHFTAGGEGGVENIVPLLEDDQIQYALVRIDGVQGDGAGETTVRDVFLAWIGPEVGMIEKSKKSGYLGDAQIILQPYHADVTVVNKDRLNRETLLDKSQPLSDSHVID